MPVVPVKTVEDVSKTFVAEVTTTETRTWKSMIISVDSRQEETRRSETKMVQIAPLSEREDDWFALFDIIREKPVVVPPGTFLLSKALCTLTFPLLIQGLFKSCL